MAKLIAENPKVVVSATFELDEEEVAALDALAGYGVDAFLTVFYEKMGEAYLKPHEAGLRRILEAARGYAGPALQRASSAREILRSHKRA